MRRSIVLICLFLAGALPGAVTPTATAGAATSPDKPGFYEKDGDYFAVGEAVHVVATRDKAEKLALQDAVARAAALLEKKGLGKKRQIEKGVENAVVLQTDLGAFKLGKAKIETVYQERWEAPDGKEAWNARVMISIRKIR